jgi:hypothetical protein
MTWGFFGRLGLIVLAGTRAQAQAAPPPAEPASVKVTPYGSVYLNGFHNSDGSNNQDVPLWALGGKGDTGATARQSRFGFRVAVPSVFGAKTTAAQEADFFGGFPAIGTGENFGQLRLRLALVRFDWTKTSLVLGQDWMVFAPQNPSSLACAAIPLFAAAGNSAFLAQPNSGSLSEWPYLQGRLAWTAKDMAGSGKPGAVGLSGHYGQSRVIPPGAAAVDLRSTGGALDWSIPLGKHLLFAGEAFWGENLAGFQSGIFQGINPDAVPPPGGTAAPAGIATQGGWAQLVVTPGASKFSLLAAYGLDDPDDDDLRSVSSRNWRTRNQVASFALQYRASAHLSLGLDYRLLKTRFTQMPDQENQHLNLAAVLAF